MDSSLLTSLIAAGSATGGVLLKMAYDGVLEHVKTRKEKAGLFLDDRRRLYDRFLELNEEVIKYRSRLQEIGLIARAGKQVKSEVLEKFPTSPMSDLVSTLDAIRRMAHTSDIVKIAQRIVALHGEACAALRCYLSAEGLIYGLPLFLANRLGEDQVLEFVAAYRKDLGIGPPVGSRKDYPRVDYIRPIPTKDAEQILRSYLGPYGGLHTLMSWPTSDVGKPLSKKDAKLLETPKYIAMLFEENQA